MKSVTIVHMDFGTVITAMVTPFDKDGSVHYEEAVRLVQHLIDHGSNSIVLAGTTGEAPTLTHDEEFRLFKHIIDHFKGKIPIIAGTGSNSTATAIKSTQEAAEMGVDAVLQVVPYYNKPSQEGLFQHFTAVADNSTVPIFLYNIPGRTSLNMEPETIAKLSHHNKIIGVKEANGICQVEAIRYQTSDDFLIYSGDDDMTLPYMEKGAHGVVSVASHLVGDKIQEMISLFNTGKKDLSDAISKQLVPLFKALFITTNPTPIKAAMTMLGFQVGDPRLPLIPATEDEKQCLKTALLGLGILDQ
ncbi:MAG: 4-hydroxy-tetrahydrodipicolinate synthase [Candidatus Margulisbacteria bacterium]|nr:4-hydroxy-tetrahydrodipicolinate synthase [Candidatus Margulisiibacteriota bacterium]